MSATAPRWADPRRHFAAMTAAARRWAVPRWDLASMTAAARRHWLILAILAPAIALRVLAQLAYKPLLLYIDSYVYLGNLHRLDPTGDYPIGYDLFLRPVLWLGNLVAVVAVLTWNRRPGFVAAASAGVLLGAAVVVRLVGEPLVLAAILFVAVAGSGRWRRLGLAVTVAACFAVPIGAYAGFYHSRTGILGISATGGAAAYGRVV